MSLSKVYRGADVAELREFHFSFFDEGGKVIEKPFVPEAPPQDKAAVPVAPSVNTAATKQELDEACNRGRREAMEQAGKKLESSARAFAAAVAELERLRVDLINNSRDDMLRLVMVIAEQLIRREVSVHPDIVVKVIEQALQASVRADHCRIKINPQDMTVVTEQKPLFLASISGLKNLIIEGDPTVTAGGCRVESDLGEVDATVESQLESIRQTLQEGMA